MALVAFALFAVGALAGYTWAMHRQLEAGILRQRAEAAERPDWVALRTLPSYVPLAFVAVADPAFVNRKALGADAGEVTLSRSLVNQVHLLRENVPGSAKEMVMGPLLETRLTKRALLELYLNRVYLGNHGEWPVFGIYHAAQEYLGKGPAQMTLAETAALASLLLPPRIVDPGEQAGAVGIRRNEVLRQMLDRELISREAYASAIQEPLPFQPGARFAPMTRPAGWTEAPEPLHLPVDTVSADSVSAGAGSGARAGGSAR